MKVLFLALLMLAASCGGETQGEHRLIVFVCDHGAAKSVIAAELFNREARRQGLPFQALARGVVPAAAVPTAVAERLFGQNTGPPRPERLDPSLARQAHLIVSFTSVPPGLLAGREPARWTSPPVSAGYEAAEATISRQVRSLISSLAEENGR